MDINQLRAFITVAHTRNLTRAAEKLFLSQPAVTSAPRCSPAPIAA